MKTPCSAEALNNSALTSWDSRLHESCCCKANLNRQRHDGIWSNLTCRMSMSASGCCSFLCSCHFGPRGRATSIWNCPADPGGDRFVFQCCCSCASCMKKKWSLAEWALSAAAPLLSRLPASYIHTISMHGADTAAVTLPTRPMYDLSST